MRFVILLLFVAAFAGCISSTGSSEDNQGTSESVMSTPETDGADTVKIMRDFASQFPNRRLNSPDHIGSRDYLASEFEALGLDVWRHEFSNGIDQENIVGIQWGTSRDHWVVIGGHYDSFHNDCIVFDELAVDPCPGTAASTAIYDDGSGVALTLGLAKAFQGIQLDRTLVWVSFDGEERGTQGSRAFVASVLAGESPFGPITLDGFLDLDMIGLNYPGVDAPIYFHENRPELLDYVFERLDAREIPRSAVKSATPSLSSSDYASFMAEDIPTGYMVSDFQEFQLPADVPLTTPNGAYPFWHLADTWENMVLMAGSEADVISGFQVAQDIAADVVIYLASQG